MSEERNSVKRIFLLLTLVVVFLFGSCSNNEDHAYKLQQVDFSQSYISETDYFTWDNAYAPVLNSWRKAISEDFGSDYSENSHETYPYIPEFNVSDWLTADTFYAYYDIDANGTAELLIAGYEKMEDWYYIFDIYTLKVDNPVRLLESLTDNGFDRDIDLLYINPSTGTITYPLNDGEFKHCQVYCRIASNGYSAQFIEAFNTWDRKSWTYYPGSLSVANAKEITPEVGNELLSKYSSEISSQHLLANLVWQELAPSAISKASVSIRLEMP